MEERGRGDDEDHAARAIDECIRRLVDERGWSGVLLVERGGTTLAARAVGLADRSEGRPNTLDTRFQVASGCKAFTAVAVCRLVAEGALSLDTRLVDCLDERFPHFDPAVTIRQLLSHAAGIGDYFDEAGDGDYAELWAERPTYAIRRPADFLPLFRDAPQSFEPGSRFQYNNAGYVLLGLVVERLRERPFARCVEESVLAPAGMTDSGFFALDRLPERTAHAYIDEPDGGWRTNVYSVPAVGGADGGAFATAGDLGRFWRALEAGVFFDDAMVRTMLSPALSDDRWGEGPRYGLGFWLPVASERAPTWYLCGWDPGVGCLSARHASWEVTVTVLSNADHSCWCLHDAVVEALAPSLSS